jgi:hypothetical protein
MVDRKELVQCLTLEWEEFITRFEQLSAQEKRAYLDQQGYPRFADLLAHFGAWWKLGMVVIHHLQVDPDYHHPHIDVASFNAEVIQSARNRSEVEVRAEFEQVRQELLVFLETLSDEDLANPRINRQLQIELIDHLAEHN